eukprot:m.209412 g.209412  ORF g.209412 m.209412 type:complete len:492 (+) comp22094_c3_seq6:955-2430(+)
MHALAALLAVWVAGCTLQLAAAGVEEHLTAASAAMKNRDFNTALEHYHAAVAAEPSSYMNYMRRATVLMALGRYRVAIKDFDTILEKKPDFNSARSHRADLLTKQGEFALAEQDWKYLTASDETAQQHLAETHTASMQAQQGLAFADAGQCDMALPPLSDALQVAPNSETLRMARAKCYMATGQLGEAVGDVLKATKMGLPNTDAYLLLSRLYYKMGETGDALLQIRECVKLDDDHKDCWKLYRHLKKFDKSYSALKDAMQRHNYGEVLQAIEKARKLESTEPFYVNDYTKKQCVAQANLGQNKEAVTLCTSYLATHPDDVEVLESRAKAYINLEELDNAVRDYEQATQKAPDDQRLRQELDKAQRLLKQSLKRNYYKILGVPRDANKKQISKAYRKLANEWHPDKFQDPKEREEAEKFFLDLRDAKEVLSDDEMRRMYDNGQDPLDAEENRERQQNPWGHGGGGGGGHPFHFHQGGFGGGGGQRFHFRHG